MAWPTTYSSVRVLLMRNLVVFLVALCLFWQGAVHAGVATQILNGLEQSHALMHFLGVSHHHHQDNLNDVTARKHQTSQENSDATLSVHQDASAESLKHILVDFGIQLPAIVEDSLKLPTFLAWQVNLPSDTISWSSAELKLIERPPRHLV
jgi:hypothetical protein